LERAGTVERRRPARGEFVIKDSDVMWGTLPFVAIMIAAVILICAFPVIAMWLPKALMG
jgi:TRAP-type mannitol/chloroaromatic compound transport system permease large subunit